MSGDPEKGWSQGELALKVGSDARQISRYENDRITPSTEVVVKLAETFDVSLDYLLIEGVPRRPLRLAMDNALLSRLGSFQDLDLEDRDSLLRILDALLAKNRLRVLVANL